MLQIKQSTRNEAFCAVGNAQYPRIRQLSLSGSRSPARHCRYSRCQGVHRYSKPVITLHHFQGRNPGALPEPIDAAQHRPARDDIPLQPIFPGKVHEHDAKKDGYESLAWQKEHEHSGQQKDQAQNIFEDQHAQAKARTTPAPRGLAPPVRAEVVSGDAGGHHGKDRQRPDEHQC